MGTVFWRQLHGKQTFRMNLSNSMRIFFCVASSGGTIFNTLRSPDQKAEIPKNPAKSYLSLNPALGPAAASARLPIGERHHLHSSHIIPISVFHLRAVGSTFSKNAFALEKTLLHPTQSRTFPRTHLCRIPAHCPNSSPWLPRHPSPQSQRCWLSKTPNFQLACSCQSRPTLPRRQSLHGQRGT